MSPSSLGVNIQWDSTAYTVSEDSEIVQLVLLKEGFTVSNVSVEVMTAAGSAIGEIHQACKTCNEMCSAGLFLHNCC